ncbi:TetR/AcrR family transcriptional regulator C-terminal domain-containing protein [Streptomyces sp. DSM 3412]|uniref:TetR/AcrR family transcriptional regulator C-terminal domain-containing protein n=1 Tax=Streptomyces gottesmaniae TaxID=3075518 RepID=A0ABU2YPH3_9ACTN|nr:TetR/AcrR family transcriptional regulator C-terminal domain-containing protein [Streptomyces sp. DSM 3412]MDT0566195.1 TetR/AcrR family transcriptional regulator C-terminal domain-containing protein [Streptomyces sp. DSM 3412]
MFGASPVRGRRRSRARWSGRLDGPCPHPFLEGADGLVQVSGAGSSGDGLGEFGAVQHREVRARPQWGQRAALRHEWLADLLGGRPALGPNALAVTEATLAPLVGRADIDTVMRAVETVSAYFTGAIRREVAHLRAERATGLSKLAWQRASGPHVTKMLATGRFPALAEAVYDGTDVDAEASFATGLEWILDAVAAKLTRPQA